MFQIKKQIERLYLSSVLGNLSLTGGILRELADCFCGSFVFTVVSRI